MGLNIYKPGQGYWTRLLSGLGAGILMLGGADWIWTKLQVYSSNVLKITVPIAIVAVFTPVIYWLVAVKPGTSDFLIATEGEMKKVNWPNRSQILGSTWVVIACVILMSTLLFCSDLAFSRFFQWIHVLDIR